MKNIDESLLYLQKNKHNFSDTKVLFTISRLASSSSLSSDSASPYDFRFLYLFSPSFNTCKKLLSICNIGDLNVLKCCIMYGYNSLYFDNCVDYDFELYEIAAKTNNFEVYNHQISLCDDNLVKLPLEFCYSLYLL